VGMIVVEMLGITKHFPGVLANSQVNLQLQQGEVHGLLGENGAGKTTLMNILFGLYQPDEGKILVRGRPVTLRSPADAIRLGIGMVHQHFRLVPPFTVAENIILGLKGGTLVDLPAAEREIAEVSERYGLKIDPRARVQQLSVGQQQRVEIVSSLYRGAEVLILDEPTAVLTPQEAEALVAGLRKMAAGGKSIVFISHKLEEVLRLTDRVTVLRAGAVVFSSMTRDTSKADLAKEMIGRDLVALRSEQKAIVLALAGAEDTRVTDGQAATDAAARVLLEVQDLHVTDDRGLPAVRGVDLTVHAGEILGIAGVDGNGQRELAEAIVRLRRVESGRLLIDGSDATAWGMRDFVAQDTAYIPDDRQRDGLILDFDLTRNAVLKTFERPPYAAHGLLNYGAIASFTRSLVDAFDVRTPNAFVRAGALSGGNQQKLILGRELSREPRFIVCNKPTRGLDIGAAAYIQQKLLDERGRGAGILLISADLDELMVLSDRILVMYNGKSMGVLEARTADPQVLGLMMAGTPLAEAVGQEAAP
jgi:general nucleoside transport system ATP-binding protein